MTNLGEDMSIGGLKRKIKDFQDHFDSGDLNGGVNKKHQPQESNRKSPTTVVGLHISYPELSTSSESLEGYRQRVRCFGCARVLITTLEEDRGACLGCQAMENRRNRRLSNMPGDTGELLGYDSDSDHEFELDDRSHRVPFDLDDDGPYYGTNTDENDKLPGFPEYFEEESDEE